MGRNRYCCRREKKQRLSGYKKNKNSTVRWGNRKSTTNTAPNTPKKMSTHGKILASPQIIEISYFCTA